MKSSFGVITFGAFLFHKQGDIMYKKSIQRNLETEEMFSNLAEMRGFKVEVATGVEQIDHIDFHLTSNEEDGRMTAMVDVKGNKDCHKDWIWIEFKNVQGKDGWIYGISDFIAFEEKNFFLLCYRKELCDWCLEKVDLDVSSPTAEEAEYIGFSRKGKQDLISKVLVDDIKNLPHTQVWKK